MNGSLFHVQQAAVKAGIEKTILGRRRLPAADCWRLYYEDGLPLRQVAALLGCTHEGVRRRLLAAGGTLRGRGDRSGVRR